jgi:hypothetical protein
MSRRRSNGEGEDTMIADETPPPMAEEVKPDAREEVEVKLDFQALTAAKRSLDKELYTLDAKRAELYGEAGRVQDRMLQLERRRKALVSLLHVFQTEGPTEPHHPEGVPL